MADLDVGLFWIAAFLMTAIVVATIAWPVLRQPVALPRRAEHDVEVYDAQLRELRDDVERGVVPPAEAAGARAEIARRLLRASAEATSGFDKPACGMPRLIAVPLVLIVVAALPLYLELGNPTEPDRPLVARLAVDPAKADLPTLVAQAEARLRDNPGDGRGWEALVPIYLRTGRAADAVAASENAIRLLGSTADRQVALGDARTQAAAGEVTQGAETAFQAALREDPENGPARFFLGVRLWQQDKTAEATAAWAAIVDKGPADAPWADAARRALADARRILVTSKNATQTSPGPSADDVAAASALPDADRSAMIAGMVSQLAERLESAPKDPDGWKRLMRSYAVLGNEAAARGAYAKAKGIFADGSPDRRSIDEFAETLGLGGEKANP